MKNFKLKDLMVSIQPPKTRLGYANNEEILFEAAENCFMRSDDACVGEGTKSCSPPSNDDCDDAGTKSCSPPSNDDCTIEGTKSCSPPSTEVEDKLNFENDGIAINELKKSIAALQKLS